MGRRRRRSGISLTGILIIGAILYFTGAGAWLWARTKQLPSACYSMLASMNTSIGEPICDGLSRGLDSVGDGTSGMLDRIKDKVGVGTGGAVANMEDYANNLFSRIGGGNSSLGSLTSSGSRLREMMSQQPIVLPSIVDSQERLRMALDQFVIGQHYLQGLQTSQALPWLQQSAQQPGGYGVLSQLTLGDMYRTGSYGVSPNVGAARTYYEGALQSISSLQMARTNESRQLLGSLPADPNQIKAQLEQQLQRMR